MASQRSGSADSDLSDGSTQVSAKQVQMLQEAGRLREALLYERRNNDRVRCHICQRRCLIPPGRIGYCKTKVNVGGTLYTTIYGVVSSAAADPIEKKPVFHYKPGSRVFSVGSLGCNFRCQFCQNWQIAYADGADARDLMRPNLMPEEAIRRAKSSGCEGIAWTYNEPAIWLNYALDCAKLAKKAGLYTVYVTNGYATPEGLDAIGPYLDVYRVDIKSLSAEFYRKLIKVPSLDGILAVAKRAKDKWQMHVEVVTNVVPTWNDDAENLSQTASWIRDNLGELTPWHVTRFFPHAKMMNLPPTPLETLIRARAIGQKEGLRFVYIGNAAIDGGQDTYCPKDGKLVISRAGYGVQMVAVDAAGRCAYDGTDLGLTP